MKIFVCDFKIYMNINVSFSGTFRRIESTPTDAT